MLERERDSVLNTKVVPATLLRSNVWVSPSNSSSPLLPQVNFHNCPGLLWSHKRYSSPVAGTLKTILVNLVTLLLIRLENHSRLHTSIGSLAALAWCQCRQGTKACFKVQHACSMKLSLSHKLMPTVVSKLPSTVVAQNSPNS